MRKEVNESKVPKLRFKGFTDDWMQRPLNKVATVNSGKDYKHLQKGDIPVYGTGGYMKSVNDSLSKRNAVGIGRKGTINKPQLLIAPFWTVDTLFFITPKENLDLNFFYYLTQTINWLRYDESTGVPSLSKKTIDKIKLKTPTHEEQIKIGNLLKSLDSIITLEQERYLQIYRLKYALYQHIFGMREKKISLYFNIPQLNWNSVIFEDIIASTFKGTTKVSDLDFRNGSTEYLDTDRLNNGVPIYCNNEPNVKIDDILILWDGSKAGKIYSGFEGVLGSTLKSYTLIDEVNSNYIYHYFKFNEEKISHSYTTPNIPHVIKNFTSIFKILLPDYKDQVKIGTLLERFDKILLEEKSKIERYQIIKSVLLFNMFV